MPGWSVRPTPTVRPTPPKDTYGHSRIRNLIVGSTTTAMLRSCQVPLLLLR